jgi:hypothetical protein
MIIEMTIRRRRSEEDEVCLEIIKSATRLVTWMMEIDIINPCYYIEYFRQEDIVDKLDAAVKAMVNLERYVVMTGGGADEKEGYVTRFRRLWKQKNKLLHSSHRRIHH